MIIEVDYREKKLIKILKSLLEVHEFKNITIDVKNLPLGDIIIKDEEKEFMIIERKSLNDLASSIKDGRYREQSYRLTNTPLHNHRIVYLIEGDLSMWSNNRINIKSDTLYVTMFSLLYYQGFSVIRTINIAETAEYILRMVDKMIRNKKGVFYYENENKDEVDYCDLVKREKSSNITIENIDKLMLSQIPSVSIRIADSLMNHFKSLKNLMVELEENRECLREVVIQDKNMNERKLTSKVRNNICMYLLKEKPSIIKIST